MATQASVASLGMKAPTFSLPATDGKTYSLDRLKGARGTIVIFMCNHCPYVKAVTDRIVRDAKELEPFGVATVAISSNDARAYPEDSFENMKAFAAANKFPFPYLYDEDQSLARAYGALCTPDFFGFNADLQLAYRGRLDGSRKDPAPPGARRELFEAMQLVAETGKGPAEQMPSVGCSIKWKDL